MSFVLPDLPYPKNSFPNVISSETFDYHHDKHHQTYVNNLNNLIKGTEWEKASLTDIVIKYFSFNLDVLTLRSTTMLLSTGTILSTGIASPLMQPNLQLNLRL